MVEFIATLASNKKLVVISNQQEPNNRGRSMKNRSKTILITGEPDTIGIVSVSQCASYFSFPKGKHEV